MRRLHNLGLFSYWKEPRQFNCLRFFAYCAWFFAAGLSSSLAVLGFSLPLCKKVELVTQNRTFEYRHIKKVKLVIRFYYYQSSINCKSPVHRGKPLFRSSPTQLFFKRASRICRIASPTQLFSKRASRICRIASPTPLFCRKAYDLLVSAHQTSTLPFTSRCLKLRI